MSSTQAMSSAQAQQFVILAAKGGSECKMRVDKNGDGIITRKELKKYNSSLCGYIVGRQFAGGRVKKSTEYLYSATKTLLSEDKKKWQDIHLDQPQGNLDLMS